MSGYGYGCEDDDDSSGYGYVHEYYDELRKIPAGTTAKKPSEEREKDYKNYFEHVQQARFCRCGECQQDLVDHYKRIEAHNKSKEN